MRSKIWAILLPRYRRRDECGCVPDAQRQTDDRLRLGSVRHAPFGCRTVEV